MKKIINLLLVMFMGFSLLGCSCSKEDNNKIEYTHYVRGGGSEKLKATILWEYANDTYTKYQVAYTSYVCTDPSVNYINVIYIELINRGTKEASIIRDISFSTLEETYNTYNVGLWGDDKVSLGKEFYSGIENSLLAKLRLSSYATISNLASKGFRNYTHIEGIDNDAISGGTISASNVVSIVKAIFDYHIENYY